MTLLYLAACGAGGLALFNEPPVIAISEPARDAAVAAGAPLVVHGDLSDDRDAPGDIAVHWFVDGVAVEGATVHGEDGAIEFTLASGLAAGERELRVRAVDSAGETGTDSRTLVAVDNTAPSIAFQHPLDGGYYPDDEVMEVEFRVDDDGAHDPGLRLSWEGAADGDPDARGEVDEPGTYRFSLEQLPAAAWWIGVTVTDALGQSHGARVAFTVIRPDADGDGARDDRLEGGTDCDDTSADVGPTAPEVCDGRDNDCDGGVDVEAVDAIVSYPDRDGDRYGAEDGRVASCSVPAGHIDRGGDCDDGDPDVNPGAVEVCNGIDDNCDGDADLDAVDAFDTFYDGDGDGYGAGIAFPSCSTGDGWVDNADDCDDACTDCHPGGVEVCDALDQDEDCDGLIDDDDPDVGGAGTWYADDDGDGRGDDTRARVTCDPPLGWVATAGDCNDADALAYTGAPETCEDGSDNDCSGGDASCRLAGERSLADADAIIVGATLDASGQSVAIVGDADGDGLADLVVGGWNHGGGAGAAWFLGTADGGFAPELDGYEAFTGSATGTYAGWAVAQGGDQDGDGLADIAIGAPAYLGGAGALYVVAGGTAGGALDSVYLGYAVGEAGDSLGSALDGGLDIDGDGDPDVLVGAPGAQAAALCLGPLAGTLAAAASFSGPESFGSAVALAGDLDGDGVGEIAVGAYAADAVYLFSGDGTGAIDVSGATAAWAAATGGDSFGWAVAAAGDATGDGYGDLLVGEPEADVAGSASGAAYVFAGGSSLVDADSSAAVASLTGITAGDRAGYTLAGNGDLDGDAAADLVIGAYYDSMVDVGAGAAYLVYGPVAGALDLGMADASFPGEDGADSASRGLDLGGDVDGDGFDDLLVGAPGNDAGGGAAGATYLLLGGGG